MPWLVAHKVDAGDVHAHAVRRLDAGDGRSKYWLDAMRWRGHDAVRDAVLRAVDVGEEGLERLDALGDAGRDDVPLVGADDARNNVQAEGRSSPRRRR